MHIKRECTSHAPSSPEGGQLSGEVTAPEGLFLHGRGLRAAGIQFLFGTLHFAFSL